MSVTEHHPSDHDPEKSLSPLHPVPSTTSTVDEAIDAEARYATNPPAGPTSSKIDDNDPGPPPDGGFQAWLQVAGSFFLFFNSWGTVNSFGVSKSSVLKGHVSRTSGTYADHYNCFCRYFKPTTRTIPTGRNRHPISPGSAPHRHFCCSSSESSRDLSTIRATSAL
jgi:hypothetical protein